jgi:cobalt-zinc-cadmium efflux system protein
LKVFLLCTPVAQALFGNLFMAHNHHHHHHNEEHQASGNIVFAFWINTVFALIEIVGGFYTNSVAILSDAVHDLGDSLSLGLAYYFQKKSQQKEDVNFNYGYKRFSLLGAFINSVILTVSSVFIISESIQRLSRPEQPDARGMMILALIGIAANVWAMLRLKKGKSINEKVVSLHFLEDVLGWCAVLIGSIVMMFADIPVLDPVLSILISTFIVWNVYKNLKVTFRILMQGSPENFSEAEIRKKVLDIRGVKDIHDAHSWTLDGQYNIMTLHVVVDQNFSLSEIQKTKEDVRHCLQHFNLQHITIEMEPEDQNCEMKKSPTGIRS